MTKNPIVTLGEVSPGDTLQLDLWKLLGTRLIVTASSGSGKSWLLRVLAEQCLPLVQTFIIDPEGEYGTLREKFDLMVVGEGGDLVPSVSSARLLARKLVESQVSAVIDLYDIEGVWDGRREFVAEFFDGLLNLPRALRKPILIILDEAHQFAPQMGSGGKKGGPEAKSTKAVKDMFGAGRKRGLACCVATQRVTKLHNDVIAECKNVFIGGTNLLADKARAGDMLGMAKAEFLHLHEMEAGQFYTYGPALVTGRGHAPRKGVIQFKTGQVQTTHPSMGERHELVVPAASDTIKLLVGQMGDLPKQVHAEAKTVADLRAENAQLRHQLATRPVQVKPEVQRVVERIEVPVIQPEQIARLESSLAQASELDKSLAVSANTLGKTLMDAYTTLSGAIKQARLLVPVKHIGIQSVSPIGDRYRESAVADAPAYQIGVSAASEGGNLAVGERKILIVVASRADGVMRGQLTVTTGYKRSSRDTYIQRLSARGYVTTNGGEVRATPAGVAALGADYERLPTGPALQAYWLERLKGGELTILKVALASYPAAIERNEISEQTNYKRSSRDTYIQRLMARKLVTNHGSGIRATDMLFNQEASDKNIALHV